MGKIVVIGSSNTDLVIRMPRIPSPGETLIGSDFMINAGGKGANQAVAAARMGGDVCLVACVGDDQFGAEAVRHYADEGIDTTYIVRRSGVASGVALIAVDDAAENSIVVAPGANALLSPADIDAAESEIAAADYLLVQLEIPMGTVARATELAVRHGVRVILNPAPAAPIADEVLAEPQRDGAADGAESRECRRCRCGRRMVSRARCTACRRYDGQCGCVGCR